MIFNIWELIEYASSIVTLFPGDVVNSGTTGGTSSGAFKTGARTGYLKPGETIEATIEGIGTLRHPVVAGKPLPTDPHRRAAPGGRHLHAGRPDPDSTAAAVGIRRAELQLRLEAALKCRPTDH